MATITPVVRQKLNAEGEAPVCLRVADGRRTLYFTLGIRVKPAHWLTSKPRVGTKCPHADEVNETIRRWEDAANAEVYRRRAVGDPTGAREIVGWLRDEAARERGGESPDSADDFFALGDEMTLDRERRNVRTGRRYRSVLGKFEEYAKRPLAFSDITPTLLRRYQSHLADHHANEPNTAISNLKVIRAVYYQAIKEGKADQGSNPFFSFKIPQERRGKKIKLTPKEIGSIRALDIERRRTPAASLWNVRNYFLFSFYCAGIRFSDLAELRWSNLNEDAGRLVLSYRMGKNDALKTVRLVPDAAAIVGLYGDLASADPARFLFPLLDGYDLSTEKKRVNALGSRNTQVNEALKELAREAKIREALSFHVARHSFAMFALRNGWTPTQLGDALIHESLRTTESYIESLGQSALDGEMDRLFGGSDGE